MRWAPVAAALVFLTCALVWLAHDPRLARHGFEAGSSLSTAPEGLSLARAYLASQGTAVGTLTRPISENEPPAQAVVFRVLPRSPRLLLLWSARDAGASLEESAANDEDENEQEEEDVLPPGAADAGQLREEGDAGWRARAGPSRPGGLLSVGEERFVAAGGRLVLAVNERYGPLGVEVSTAEPLQKVFPALPGVRELAPGAELALTGAGLDQAVAVFERGPVPVVARRTLGKGEVWLLANPELFFNARLAHQDNLALLAALAGGGRPVLFDESVHGVVDDPGILGLFRRWGFGPALLLLGLALGIWFWRRAVPLGPPSGWRDLRTESVDLVDALAQLYQRALRPQDELALHYARLLHELQLRLGLGPEQAARRARELTGGWELPAGAAALGRSEFQRHLGTLNQALRRLRDDRPRRT